MNAQSSIGWRAIGGTSISEGFAGPTTGPVNAVWYSGTALLAQTASGRVFETADFEHWRLSTEQSAPSPKLYSGSARQYQIRSDNLFASSDAGGTWVNVTAAAGESILGGGFTSLAVSPADPADVTVSNAFGAWRSLDGGTSWRGLNDGLPALPVRKIVDRGRIQIANGSLLELLAGIWVISNAGDPEAALRAQFAASAHAEVTAALASSSISYAGTSDGRLLYSRDGGTTWLPSTATAGLPEISRIWADSAHPDSALAIAGPHVLRTVNGGLFWDDVTSGLPETQLHGVTADSSAGVVYLASDRGVFSGNISLHDAGPVNPAWRAVSQDLPAAAAWDVRLNGDNTLTVALDGYGVFEEPAPHRTRAVRIVNGADMSDRPAAPGSLVSVLGAEVRKASGGSGAWPVIAASPQSSQIQVPFETGAGTLSIRMESLSQEWTAPLVVKEAAPAIFVDSEGVPLILDAASGLVFDPKTPIYAGSTVQIMATGLGKVSPDWPTGAPAPPENPPAAVTPISAFLDGAPIEVTRATLAPGYVGYYIVELRIPTIVNRGANELRLVMNGEESNRVRLYLEPDLPK